MQSAIVVLVISFIWFYIGCFPFKYYIHESFHSHSCMNSFYSFMCSYMVLWLLLSLDIIGMFPYILLYCYPLCYTNDSRCYNPQVVFFLVLVFTRWLQGGFMCLCWVANISFLSYRTTHPRIYLRNENLATCKNYSFSSHNHSQPPTNENDHSKTLYKGLAQCIIGDQKRAYTSNKRYIQRKPPHVINVVTLE